MNPDLILALVTCPRDAADALARGIVESRTAACVNVIPQIASTYRWKGEVCRDDEALLVIKTTRDRFEALEAEVLARHPYELPEVIALPIVDGHAPYLAWIAESVRF